jgi:hypothetical protein
MSKKNLLFAGLTSFALCTGAQAGNWDGNYNPPPKHNPPPMHGNYNPPPKHNPPPMHGNYNPPPTHQPPGYGQPPVQPQTTQTNVIGAQTAIQGATQVNAQRATQGNGVVQTQIQSQAASNTALNGNLAVQRNVAGRP